MNTIFSTEKLGIDFQHNDDWLRSQAKCIAFDGDNILLHTLEGPPVFDVQLLTESNRREATKYYVGLLNGNPLYVFECLDKKVQALFCCIPVKQYLQTQEDVWCGIIVRSKQLLYWHKNNVFCGTCGHQTTDHALAFAKICTQCEKEFYPTMAPAVMVLITWGDYILLGRSHHFRPSVYSNLAGFIEPGESAEQAIVREVKEEVGISLSDIRYFGSQPWPFQNTFLLAYVATYQSGEIAVNTMELEDAQWFSIHALPPLPYTSSIARKMIDAYMQKIG